MIYRTKPLLTALVVPKFPEMSSPDAKSSKNVDLVPSAATVLVDGASVGELSFPLFEAFLETVG